MSKKHMCPPPSTVTCAPPNLAAQMSSATAVLNSGVGGGGHLAGCHGDACQTLDMEGGRAPTTIASTTTSTTISTTTSTKPTATMGGYFIPRENDADLVIVRLFVCLMRLVQWKRDGWAEVGW